MNEPLENEALKNAARIAVRDVLKVKAGEQALIVTNPLPDVEAISRALYEAAEEAGGRPTIVIQSVKTSLDFAEKTVIAALGAKPEVIISMSAEKFGKDEAACAKPYEHKGEKFDSLFHYLTDGIRCSRSFWSPSVTIDMFLRTVPIDYALLRQRCAALGRLLTGADSVRVTAPAGTDITLSLAGRAAKSDDGDFSFPGAGGNLPAGETFISPALGTAEGTIAFDGSIALAGGETIIRKPIICRVKNGFVTDIEGGAEAELLRDSIRKGEDNARAMEKEGRLAAGQGEIYARNARNIGELGIGLNPAARITGHMLEDEKAFRTCHFAIGSNYDNDANAIIHLDGLVKEPTIVAFAGGAETTLLERGELRSA